jgi:hypothetical protein
MARPRPKDKKTVNLATGGARVSRIRRDPPPPPPRKITPGELRDREARTIVLGLAVFVAALGIVLVHLTQWAGWSPRDYTITIRDTR